MNKKDYLKPTMVVVKLQHQAHLLSGSVQEAKSSSVQDYEWHNEAEE